MNLDKKDQLRYANASRYNKKENNTRHACHVVVDSVHMMGEKIGTMGKTVEVSKLQLITSFFQ